MDVVISCSKTATEVAKDALLSDKRLKTPVLVFVDVDDWERIEGRDEVDLLNDDDAANLERFKDKKAVFCRYEDHEREGLDELARYWKRIVGGDSVRVVTMPGFVSKFWLARRIADKVGGYEAVLQYFRRLPVVAEKSFPLPGRDDLLYDPETMLEALEGLKEGTRSAKVLLAAKAGIEEIKAVYDGKEKA